MLLWRSKTSLDLSAALFDVESEEKDPEENKWRLQREEEL